MPSTDLLTTAQAARELDVHRSTVTRMVEAGKLEPAVRGDGLRGGMFFHASAIAKVKDQQTSGALDASPSAAPAGAPESDGGDR